jgi:hypothetical protein
MILTATLLLALAPAAQTPAKDTNRLKPLLPPPAAAPVAPPGAAATSSTPAPEAAVDRGSGPRPLPTDQPPPFEHDRPLLDVDGARIMASELNELVQYYRSYRPAATDLLLQDAVAALLPLKVVQSRYPDDLVAMRTRLSEAVAALRDGRAFAEVVRSFSDDDEAEDPEGRYTFPRGRAVQPFDRVAFTAEPGSGLTPMFLTVYGFHVLEPLHYERGAEAKDDLATMRHVLVMYPSLKRMGEEGVDVRAWIKQQVAVTKIRVLWAGHENLVPPQYRAQIVR